MKQTGTDINRIVLHGRAVQSPAFSHSSHEVDFFSFPLEVSRLSGVSDRINIMAAQPLLENSGWFARGEELTVRGKSVPLTTVLE